MLRRLRSLLVLGTVVALTSALGPRLMQAQDSSAATAAAAARTQVLRRAQRLVNDGSGAEGRALVDSLLNSTEPRSPEEAEVLFWRATLAESWDQAQRDYLRVMLEHERSRFAASAMLRLAQGELMRGDRDAALRYAERLLAEAPDAPERADALALRTQLTPTTAAPTAVATTTPLPTNPSTLPPTSAPAAPPGSVPATVLPPAATPRPATPAGGMVWTVQIAAFPTAEEAATFAALVRERGYETRVDGIAAPFRVRFGRYATRAAAAAAMEAYKANERADAFLAQVPR